MRLIRNLEIHVVHSCNLTCESCSHYSNQGHKGILSLADADRWMTAWNGRISPATFSLLGGEPTIHPDLAEFAALARRKWPQAKLRIVTNGFFLHRHPMLPLVLKNDPHARLCLSIHHASTEYQEKLVPIRALVGKWVEKHGIHLEIYESYKNWTRRYKGFGSNMEPFDDRRLRQSWEICPAKTCRQLFEGNIWKCSPIAYLKLQDAKYHLSPSWQPYLKYRPLEPDCTDEELNRFFDTEEESCCGMCPATLEKIELPMPLPARVGLPLTYTGADESNPDLMQSHS